LPTLEWARMARLGDIYPGSGNRLPPIARERLDEAGQAVYDAVVTDSHSLVGLRGPAGIQLHSPRYYPLQRAVNQFLRFGSGLDRRLSELLILVTAREMESPFEWRAHEIAAAREGLEPEIVDIVLRRKRVRGIGEKEAVLIKLGREAIRRHRVRRSTFAKALELFGAETLVNLTALMGNYASTALLLAVFAQQLPDGETSRLN
jgi:4-carboxymuconolactone decarboxylase